MRERATLFTYRLARSGSFFGGIIIVLVVETLALHALLRHRTPFFAWLLTLSSIAAMGWIAADFRAMGTGAITVRRDSIDLSIGRRTRAIVPRIEIESVISPSWRERPKPALDYLNAMKPADPNVLITLRTPQRVTLFGTMHRDARRIGLTLDDPTRFIALLNPHAERKGSAVPAP